MKPLTKSCLNVPLCCFLLLPLARPTFEPEVQLLENEFVNGYRDGDKVLYVLNMDDKGRVHKVMHKIYDDWDKQ